ncbi:MAG: hypothetical protein H0U23_03575, partial [Blastocatellia bacterium]|nr:hypothetical protein [Blastocatellia bacterium]
MSAQRQWRAPAIFWACVGYSLTLSHLSGEQESTAASPRRVEIPASTARVVERKLSANPSEQELRNYDGLPEPLLPVSTAKVDDGERRALSAALVAWRGRTKSDDHSALENFVATYTFSRWTPSLQLNLGMLYYASGWYSLAVTEWSASWEATKNINTAEATKVANAALAQYARMLARVGRREELSTLLGASKNRVFQGRARTDYVSASEGYAQMVNGPDRAYRCGPFALASVKEHLTGKTDITLLHDISSPEGGFNLVQVLEMAEKAGLRMMAARRHPGAPVITPSVVHLKLDHYAAILEQKNGFYRVKDPTFGSDQWLSMAAIDHEASGAFLIAAPKGRLPQGWGSMKSEEMASIHGKGRIDCVDRSGGGGSGTKTAGPPPPKPPCPADGGVSGKANGSGTVSAGGCGMAGYLLQQIPCSLIIQDSPVAYRPAFGPDMNFRASYNQRAADQPDTMLFSNFGPLWSGEFVGYLEDDATSNVTIHLRNGGYVKLSLLTSDKDITSDSRLIRVSPDLYERRFGDGSKEVYSLATAPAGNSRRVFLTQVVDPKGLALTFIYDTDPNYPTRIKQIVDASGLSTDLSYEVPDDPYLVSRVHDPFGREAQFIYSGLAGDRRLQTIRDAVGLESSFGYDSNGIITSMKTPYGTTTFTYADAASALPGSQIRTLEATGPTGAKERIEYHAEYSVPREEQVPVAPGLGFDNAFIDYRNVLYWDAKAMDILGGSVSSDPTAAVANATIFHYLHVGNAASGVLESVKRPSESRSYYHYPNQN